MGNGVEQALELARKARSIPPGRLLGLAKGRARDRFNALAWKHFRRVPVRVPRVDARLALETAGRAERLLLGADAADLRRWFLARKECASRIVVRADEGSPWSLRPGSRRWLVGRGSTEHRRRFVVLPRPSGTSAWRMAHSRRTICSADQGTLQKLRACVSGSRDASGASVIMSLGHSGRTPGGTGIW